MVFQQCQTARAMSSLPSGNGVGHRAARAVLPVGRAVVFADQGRPGPVYVRSNTHAAYAPRDQARKPQALSAEARPVGNSWLDSLARLHSLHPWSQHAAQVLCPPAFQRILQPCVAASASSAAAAAAASASASASAASAIAAVSGAAAAEPLELP